MNLQQEIFLFGRFKEYELDIGKFWNQKIGKIPNTIPEEIDAISCGSEHCFFLNKTSGNMYAIGSNDHHRCGIEMKNMNTINVPTIVNRDKIGPIELVSAGGYHTLCVRRDGEVWGFGSTSNGRLGLRNLKPFTGSGPQMISFFSNLKPKVKMVAAGHYHSLILLEDSSIYSFGYGCNGQLGYALPKTEDGCYFPRKIEYKDNKLRNSRIVSVHAGKFHSALVTGLILMIANCPKQQENCIHLDVTIEVN
jgi:alpha-tubulin suppressor-like RCC1 family protein